MTERKEVLIYVVDDEPLLLQLAEEVLGAKGYRLRSFSDPLQAWASFSKDRPFPALMITDYMMPGMTGVELLVRCKSLDPGLRTMLLSGTVKEAELGTVPVKVDRFLQKPYPAEMLEEAVRSVLAGGPP